MEKMQCQGHSEGEGPNKISLKPESLEEAVRGSPIQSWFESSLENWTALKF